MQRWFDQWLIFFGCPLLRPAAQIELRHPAWMKPIDWP